ncbi:protein of unknown function [Gillisia sp. Hel1_33_143]|uniref:DUF4168 domain-containing protein n=1 Tax=Gillisia sp. Hel1_33_143 TaxID=1336796 RepID=UPI00087AF3F2|nr:DUF4168 domain-containing protein [Gillisia sp. Hel1_33_143]SDS39016.1 protein of unknown function [Gillisia sp. Hel1_33_143]
MLNLIKSKISYIALTFGLFTGATGFAQDVTPKVEQQSAINVDDAELAKFAATFNDMQQESQKMQSKVIEKLSEREMDVNTFNAIHQAKMTNTEPTASKEDIKKYEDAVEDLEDAQKDFQDEMENLVKDAGFTIERYKEIGIALQSDTDLQNRLQKILTSE